MQVTRMIPAIFNILLILFTLFMGFRQSWAMLSGKPELQTLFSRWHLPDGSMRIMGGITLLSTLLIPFPRTFVAGNYLMAAGILFLLCLQLSVKDMKGAAIELPFLFLNLIIIYLQYPIHKS